MVFPGGSARANRPRQARAAPAQRPRGDSGRPREATFLLRAPLQPAASAAMTSEVPGEVVGAAVGWARPADPTKNGVIMEFHDKATREEAERAIVHMLAEAFRVRGWTIHEMQVCAAEHRVERTGCALAAVTLLADDDVV